jgi:hypothetical protein
MLTLVASLFLQLAATPAPPPDLIEHPDVLSYCRSLVTQSEAKDHEEGAFVVRNRDGLVYFVPWPPSRLRHMLFWRGRIPEGTIAIVHTHAPPMDGVVSKHDGATARRTGLPVYILTPRRIVKTTGDATAVVKKGKW